MGVDFFPCDYCGEAICDCGSYEKCECGRRWCDDKCAKGDGYLSYSDDDEIDEPSCKYCRREEAEDSELLDYLLRHYNLSRDKVLEDWRNEQAELYPPDAD
jgi:hypothetical protein